MNTVKAFPTHEDELCILLQGLYTASTMWPKELKRAALRAQEALEPTAEDKHEEKIARIFAILCE